MSGSVSSGPYPRVYAEPPSSTHAPQASIGSGSKYSQSCSPAAAAMGVSQPSSNVNSDGSAYPTVYPAGPASSGIPTSSNVVLQSQYPTSVAGGGPNSGPGGHVDGHPADAKCVPNGLSANGVAPRALISPGAAPLESIPANGYCSSGASLSSMPNSSALAQVSSASIPGGLEIEPRRVIMGELEYSCPMICAVTHEHGGPRATPLPITSLEFKANCVISQAFVEMQMLCYYPEVSNRSIVWSGLGFHNSC
jgi:hypothetical protein